LHKFLAAAVVLALTTASGFAQTTVNVGDGASTSYVQIVFKDGAAYQFNVAYDSATNGIDLLNVIESAGIGFAADIQNFGFGDFVNGLSYDGHANSGYGGGEDWWHYWVREAESEPWVSPATYGASGRTVSDGSWDGWVYGDALDPTAVPEPTTLAILGGAVVLMRRRRR
jgi:hypothetical protein